ncbi:molybdate ABC transporter substrate-binding protein [Aureimonas jatrophae]|uniref:Molybdate transport system substrate-binding protein n=1 Tax=Aureimonas jatrophae TaxID=1166073 RepID=A0A1H0CMH4_9HYPH|nr:molybdate ABC transporter substrate-binding protein [Aureimonas jatrophae]MBB3949301.1 molybdate transport system substrate-binding protein [Aureimonas jatrophae]SDN59107.1 molybdate transport system substrate-binding protein [Aureimonas jatrophae]
MSTTRRLVLQLGLGLSALVLPAAAEAASVNVVVAANFTDAAKEIAGAFQADTKHEAVLSFGATGAIYTQITQGAPYEVFLAADDQRPKKAVDEGYGVAGTVSTYAIGQLVLYSKEPNLVSSEATLRSAAFETIAIANPEAAPYGAAAVETMRKLGVYDRLQPKIVQGTSIAQAYQFVETGSAALGFVALGQVVNESGGSRWDVPQEFYKPIRQDVVLLKTGENNEAARAFVEYLKGPRALEIIRKYGYRTGAGA